MAKWNSKGAGKWAAVNDAAKKVAAAVSTATYVIKKAKLLYERTVKETKEVKQKLDYAINQEANAKKKYDEVVPKPEQLKKKESK